MAVQEIFDTRGNHALLCLVVCLSGFYLHLTDVKAYIPTLHRTHIKHARLHLQGTDGLEYHIVAPFRIPDGRGRQRKQRKTIAERLFQSSQVAPQEPIVHAELLAPCCYRMRLVDHHQTDAAFAYKMLDVVRKKQFRREIEQINLALAHLPVNLLFLFRRQIGRGVCHARIPQLLQTFHLVYNQRLQRRDYDCKQIILLPQIDGRKLEQQGFSGTGRSGQQNIIYLRFTFPGFLSLQYDVLYQLSLRNAEFLFSFEQVIVNLKITKLFVAVSLLQNRVYGFAAVFRQMPFLQIR